MAAKKPAKKVAKAAKKAAPAKKPVIARKAAPAAKKVAAKPLAKPAAKKAAAKPAAKPAVKKAVAKKAPAKKAPAVKKAAPAAKAVVAKKPAPKPAAKPVAKKAVSKQVAKPAAKKATPAAKPLPAGKQASAKPAGAREAKKQAPAPKPEPQKAARAAEAPKKETHKPVVPPAAKPVPAADNKKKGKVMVAVKKTSGGQSAPKGKHKVVPYKVDETSGRPILPAGYKPSADEEYMSPLQLEYFRQRLLHWRADLVEESKQTIENLREEVRDIGDEAERATRETENSLELRTRDRYRKLIGKIDSTLKRVDSGEYGFCVDTGEEIGLDRMEARLTAERTIDAQERWEHLQKQMGD
ncbi:MAG: RNA polymerase-binding protein DksA [Lysobacteraceae bacterium SCN 69-48]|nr:MAG: RNA polymerase-binding protein DksA [Xanthomonadaceae bacterium SCN 69-48]